MRVNHRRNRPNLSNNKGASLTTVRANQGITTDQILIWGKYKGEPGIHEYPHVLVQCRGGIGGPVKLPLFKGLMEKEKILMADWILA